MRRRRGSICPTPGCPHWVPTPGPCIRCGRADTTRRATTTERGYGATWQQAAAAHLATHPICVRCGATEDLTVDHITPLNAGGTGTDLQTLCRSCNSRKQDVPDEYARSF